MKVACHRWAASPLAFLLVSLGGLTAAVERWAPTSGVIHPLRASPAKTEPHIRTGALEYPRVVWDVDGVAVKVPRPARSIVSQYWSIDEFVYTVAPPELVTGVSESAYQQRISNVYAHVLRHKPVVATDPERVLRLNPDLILVSSSARADFTALVRSTGIPIVRLYTVFTTLEQVAESIRLVGYLTGQDETAQREYERFLQAVQRARRRRPPHQPPPRILGLGGRYSYGQETLFHDIVHTLGGVNVGAEAGLRGYDAINSEQILRADPEWIVAGADFGKTAQQRAKLLSDPAIALTQAAKNGRILVFDQRVFLPMSPYTRLLLEALGDELYGR
ncbi:MAG: ABC transporter substrate-binding protein [Bryobacteraceae bacterium]|nr:ABC transporter substrate-binding protein [Bryobacteraceae bacterium]MDW8377651.1 ABC transporter substrate-binding protein [Bryobacterales bacterium]